MDNLYSPQQSDLQRWLQRDVSDYHVVRIDGRLYRAYPDGELPEGTEVVQLAPCESKYWLLPRWRRRGA